MLRATSVMPYSCATFAAGPSRRSSTQPSGPAVHLDRVPEDAGLTAPQHLERCLLGREARGEPLRIHPGSGAAVLELAFGVDVLEVMVAVLLHGLAYRADRDKTDAYALRQVRILSGRPAC